MADLKIKVITAQGKMFEVDESVVSKSKLIMGYVQNSVTDVEIRLPNINSRIFEKVIEFCRHYKNITPKEIEKPLMSAVFSEVVPSWDSNFVELEQEVLFELILAANYLDIKSLLDLTCAKVASMVKGKPAKEIRRQFNIENGFTPEEEAQVREENRWAELE